MLFFVVLLLFDVVQGVVAMVRRWEIEGVAGVVFTLPVYLTSDIELNGEYVLYLIIYIYYPSPRPSPLVFLSFLFL